MDIWLKTLKTETPQEGFELAITLARKGVAYTQPDASIRDRLRPVYSRQQLLERVSRRVRLFSPKDQPFRWPPAGGKVLD